MLTTPSRIAVSITFLELFAIMLPCIQTLRQQALRQETLESIARWESRNKGTSTGDSVTDSWRSLAGVSASKHQSMSMSTSASPTSANTDSVLVIGALEYVLEKNPEPLRQFSALKDFSGENIAFLMSVAEWKCLPPPDNPGEVTSELSEDMRRTKYTRALRIYHDFITPRWADFPVNISAAERRPLELIFDDAARILFGVDSLVDPVAPFQGPDSSVTELAPGKESFGEEKSTKSHRMETFIDRILFWGEIPDEFNMGIFNDVEASIKHLVLTNTWPKFVKSRRVSGESGRPSDV